MNEIFHEKFYSFHSIFSLKIFIKNFIIPTISDSCINKISLPEILFPSIFKRVQNNEMCKDAHTQRYKEHYKDPDRNIIISHNTYS